MRVHALCMFCLTFRCTLVSFFFFFTPLSLPFFFPARRLFLLLIFFPVLIMDGLVALLTRDIEARRINTAVSSNKFVIFNFHPSSPSISKPHPFLPESRKLLSKLLQLLSVGGACRAFVRFTMGSESGFCKWCNNEDNKRKQKWRVVPRNYE